jgi:hypothetical protein
MRRLFRMRCLESFRFGKEWLVAVDGTWLRTYKRQHCPRLSAISRVPHSRQD